MILVGVMMKIAGDTMPPEVLSCFRHVSNSLVIIIPKHVFFIQLLCRKALMIL